MPSLPSRFLASRADPSLAVLEGFHAIKHAIRFRADIELVVTRDVGALDALAGRLAPDVRAELLRLAVPIPADEFDALSGTPPDTGVMAIARRRVTSLERLAHLEAAAPIVLLEAPAHSGNIGAVVRVAAAAGAAAVVTTGVHDPWNPGALRGSAGLHYALPVVRSDQYDIPGRRLVAIDPEGDELRRGGIFPGAVLAFGSERSGLSSDLLARAEQRIRIPMSPGVSSLNLATAVAVVLYTWKLGA